MGRVDVCIEAPFHQMTAEDVLKIVLEEISLADPSERNLHGLELQRLPLDPVLEEYVSFDGSLKFQYWTVLDEREDRSGYTIYYDPDAEIFGLGVRSDKGVVDVGAHGSFMNTFRGM